MTRQLITIAWWNNQLGLAIFEQTLESRKWTNWRQVYKDNAIIPDSYKDPRDFPDIQTYDDWGNPLQPNRDIPDNLQFYDMGINERSNSWLDNSAMNRIDFTQRCLQQNGRNYALYEKRAIDFKPPNHLDAEWLAQKLNIAYDLAYKLADAFRALDIDRKAANKILYGYVKSDGTRASGLANHNGSKHHVVELLETLQLELDKVTVERQDFVPIETWEENIVNYHMNREVDNSDDGLELSGDNNPFGAFPLHWESEGLTHEFINKIRQADTNKLREIQSGFFPSKSEYTGRTYQPKYRYLTASQKAQAWVYIKARKQELVQQGKANLSKDGNTVLSWIKDLGRSAMASSLIYSWMKGAAFDIFGAYIEFAGKPRPEEISYIWAEYKQLA